MNILILTSKDHHYGNLLLQSLLKKGTFDDMSLLIIEQDSLVPGKTKLQGLLYYLKKAGARYVAAQIAKQYLFSFRKFIDTVFHRSASSFFPYYRVPTRAIVERVTVSSMREPAVLQRLQTFAPDILLSLYSKDILGPDILSLPSKGAVNLHPALLPSYRGVSPTFWALANGEKVAGSTLHELDAGIDTGRILAQISFPTGTFSSEHQLYTQATLAGVELVHDYVRQVQSGQAVTPASSNAVSSYFSVPTRQAVASFYRRGLKMFTLQDIFRR